MNENFSLGDGIISTESGHLALLSGKLVEKNGVISIISDSNVNMPKVGDIVIGQVSRLNAKTAEIRILHIEGKEEGERDIPALKLFADIYVTDFVDRYIPSAGDAMRSRDFVRARYSVRTDVKGINRDDPSLGVIHAICPPCGSSSKSSTVPI